MSEDYMKYDGRLPEPPYRTLSGTMEEIEEITAERDDLARQLAAERARVTALAELVKRAYNDGFSAGMDDYRKYSGGVIWHDSKAKSERDRIMEGRDNA